MSLIQRAVIPPFAHADCETYSDVLVSSVEGGES